MKREEERTLQSCSNEEQVLVVKKARPVVALVHPARLPLRRGEKQRGTLEHNESEFQAISKYRSGCCVDLVTKNFWNGQSLRKLCWMILDPYAFVPLLKRLDE